MSPAPEFDHCPFCRRGELVFYGCAEGWQFVCARCGKITEFSDLLVGLLVEAVDRL